MDRPIVYPGQIPTDTMILETNLFAMAAIGHLARAILGSGTLVDGLACTATTPASMSVQVGSGAIYSLESLEASDYGSIAADTTHQVMKQGLSLDPLTFSCPAPAGSGQSIVYLIQAAFEETDAGSTVLPYYNADNPSEPFSGPSNTGTAQFTLRKGVCVLEVKAGVAASTGSQTTPAPDAGFTALWAITVANGATTITSANIAQVAGAPYLKAKLPSLPASVRPQLIADTTFYVATTGSDSNSGLSPSSPFQTIQKAVNALQVYDLNGHAATISVADGTYGAGIIVNGPFVGGIPLITGNVTTPGNCVINTTGSDCFRGTHNTAFNVSGFKLKTSGNGNGVSALSGSTISVVGNMEYGSIAQAAVAASDYSSVFLNAGYTISGSAVAHYSVNRLGQINVNSSDSSASPITVNVTGSPTWSVGFAVIINGGVVIAQASQVSFSGAANGSRYNVTATGLIQTNGGGLTFFPGSTTGTTATQGQYL